MEAPEEEQETISLSPVATLILAARQQLAKVTMEAAVHLLEAYQPAQALRVVEEARTLGLVATASLMESVSLFPVTEAERLTSLLLGVLFSAAEDKEGARIVLRALGSGSVGRMGRTWEYLEQVLGQEVAAELSGLLLSRAKLG